MSDWLMERASNLLASRSTRRGFLMRSSFVATALAANPLTYILRPGTAYAATCSCGNPGCGCGSTCCDGYTDFCCTINKGRNECPPGTLPGGWWKADGSIYCSGPRYYIDCNATCRCSSGSGGFCSPSCDGQTCTCAQGSCGHRAVGCRQFRYGQCHQEIGQIGRIACRLVTCTPPWQIDSSCSTASFTDNATRNHTADCPPPPSARDVGLRDDGISGYVLDGFGHLTPFGGAPGVSGAPSFGFDIARRVVLRDDKSGYVLDGWGGVHPFGGAPDPGSFAYWKGWDIARDIVVRPDGGSGYVLDGWGGVHPFGGAPDVTTTASWSGWDIARGLALRPDGVSGWVLDGYGGLHPFGDAPRVANGPYFGEDVARDVVASFDGVSGYVVDQTGAVWPFNRAPRIGPSGVAPGSKTTRALDLAPDAVSGTAVTDDGVTRPFAVQVSRRVALRSDGTSGYVLDGWGGLTPFGGAPAVTGPSWNGWDIARHVVLTGPSKGYVLDGLGALHPFGGAPSITGTPSWTFDIARTFVLRPNAVSGYVLDGQGALHPFGGAPAVTGTPSWTFDIGRDVAFRSNGTSGYVLDGLGGVHPFGGAPGISGVPYFGRDIARRIILVSDTSGYVLDASGVVHPFGGARAVATAPSWPGWLPARDLVLADTAPTHGLVLDGYGGLSPITFA